MCILIKFYKTANFKVINISKDVGIFKNDVLLITNILSMLQLEYS